jgi:hypothetical protein
LNIKRFFKFVLQFNEVKTKKLLYVRFEVFTAVTTKKAVFWDIKVQFVLYRRHITSPLQSPAS